MDDRVRAFNNIPRPKKTPSGLPNHWVFGVCHVDLTPPGDLVLAIQPKSRFLKRGGPGQILSLATAHDKAEALIPYLLDAFIEPAGPDDQLATPWTWSTLDQELAQAVQDSLRTHGVKPELCQVSICTAQEREILEEGRDSIFKVLLQSVSRAPAAVEIGDSTKCHGCGMGRECFFKPLKKCSRCNKAFYHSRDCQKEHWKRHKATCGPSPNASSLIDAFTYYNTRAPNDPEARALMTSLGLDLNPSSSGTALPLHRLVLTGKDTPENLRLFFGSKDAIKADHENARIECLLDPPPGSPSHIIHSHMGDPPLPRNLRQATEAEQQKLDEVRAMQERIRQRVGVGKAPSSQDMQAILKSCGPNWTTMLPIYHLAVNTMDQGVPAGGYR
ncbi:hypothetical protein MFIFM68171_03047 [Madurella fahalii]|uniref:MYND-type domain-containing protein n=1 Tax=Madurella fahalii TaxID=1157608 RepID=A0ABQ0G510_9PEZI